MLYCSFFFNDTATTEIYTLSLHDALPIFIGFGVLGTGIGILAGFGVFESDGSIRTLINAVEIGRAHV